MREKKREAVVERKKQATTVVRSAKGTWVRESIFLWVRDRNSYSGRESAEGGRKDLGRNRVRS